MRFFSSLSVAAVVLFSAVQLVKAGENPFSAPISGAVLTSGQAYTITW